MALPALQKGEPLVLVSEDRNASAEEVVVSRIGLVYVYVTRKGAAYEDDTKFDRVTGAAKQNIGWARTLVTPAQYAEMKEREQLLADLKHAGVNIEHRHRDTVPLVKLRGLLAAMAETDMATVCLPRDLAEEIASIIDAHMDEYPVEHDWDVIEAVRQLDPERGASMYRAHRYRVNGGTVYDVVDQVEIETEFANSDAARAWVNTHGKACASKEG